MFRFSLLFFLLVFSLIPAYSQTAKETSNNNSKIGLLLIDAQKEALIGNIEKIIDS